MGDLYRVVRIWWFDCDFLEIWGVLELDSFNIVIVVKEGF